MVIPANKKRIDEAWRTLMLAQHHDAWIVPYNGLREGRTWADQVACWTDNTNRISDEIITESVKSFETNNLPGENYIRVFNTLGFQRNEIIIVTIPENISHTGFKIFNAQNKEIPYSTEKGNRIYFRAEVPPFGYASYKIQHGRPIRNKEKPIRHKENEQEFILENDMYKITFDLQQGGTIKSLVVKNSDNKEYVSTHSEYLLAEIRGCFYDENQFHSSKESTAKAFRLRNNVYEKSVLIEGSIATHTFRQIITIRQGQRRIDFDLEIDWKNNVGIGEYKQQTDWHENRRTFYDDRYKLNVLFPVDLDTPELYKNSPFDVCKSRLDNTHFNTWDNIKNNIILNWVDLSEADGGNSLTLLTDHTTSYSYGEDFPLALTLQYSGKGLWGVDYDLTGPTHVKYALIPHKGRWDESAVSFENSTWNEPLIVSFFSHGSFENKSFIDLSGSSYELSAVQPVQEGIIVRVFNAGGDSSEQKIKFGFPYTSIEEIELNGESRRSDFSIKANSGSEILVSIPRFGLRTYYIRKPLQTSPWGGLRENDAV